MAFSISTVLEPNNASARSRRSCPRCLQNLCRRIMNFFRRIWGNRSRPSPSPHSGLSSIEVFSEATELQPLSSPVLEGESPTLPSLNQAPSECGSPPLRSSKKRDPRPGNDHPPVVTSLSKQEFSHQTTTCQKSFFVFCCGMTMLWACYLLAITLKAFPNAIAQQANTTTTASQSWGTVLHLGDRLLMVCLFWGSILVFLLLQHVSCLKKLLCAFSILTVLLLFGEITACVLTRLFSGSDQVVFLMSIVFLFMWMALLQYKITALSKEESQSIEDRLHLVQNDNSKPKQKPHDNDGFSSEELLLAIIQSMHSGDGPPDSGPSPSDNDCSSSEKQEKKDEEKKEEGCEEGCVVFDPRVWGGKIE